MLFVSFSPARGCASLSLAAYMPDPTQEEVQQALLRILASPAFVRAGRVRDFLQFVVTETLAGKADGIKESVVAIEVFHRTSDFDARIDSVVRVEAHKLRDRLRTYYATEGAADSVVIEVPKGAYVPSFRYSASDRPRHFLTTRTALWLAVAAASVLTLVVIASGWGTYRPKPLGSVAVVAFSTPENDTTLAELASALSEDISAALSQLATLRVIAPTSATQVRPGESAPAAGQRLHVEALITGSLRRTSTGVRFTVELLQARDGAKLYGQTWDRDTVALLDMSGEVASALARFSGHPLPSYLPVAATLPVQQLYWRARTARRLRSEADLQRAIAWYQQAASRDPAFSRAWAGLAEAYTDVAFHRRGNTIYTIQQAREAARTALALNKREADAHASLARIAFFCDWDWPAAEQSFREALASNPNSPSARGEFALALAARRRFGEAIDMIDTAVALDPLSTLPAFQRAVILFMSGRYRDAQRAAEDLLRREPSYYAPRALIATCLATSGQPLQALPHYERALQAAPRRGFLLGRLGAAYALSGDRARAGRIARELESQQNVDEFEWIYPAYVFAALGETAKAIECLERSAANRDSDFVFVGAEPLFQPLQSNPGFQSLLQRIGMAPTPGLGE